jgi:hypothetical protein
MISHRASRPASAGRAAAIACAALAMAVLAGCGVLSPPSASPAATGGPGGQPTPAAALPAQTTQAPPCPGTRPGSRVTCGGG